MSTRGHIQRPEDVSQALMCYALAFLQLRGSDIHVMRALRGNSRQVVVTYEELDGTDVIDEFLGKRQRLADQMRNTLSQRIIEALDMVGFPRQLADRMMLHRGNHPFYTTYGSV